LVQEANARHGLALNVNEVVFGVPVLIDDSILDLSDPVLRNSTVVMTAGGQADGRVEITTTYNRLSLSKVMQFFSTTFVDQGEETIHELLPRLSARLGYTFDASDFSPTAFEPVGEDGNRQANFTARNTSLSFFAQVLITLVPNVLGPGLQHNADLPEVPFASESPFGDWTLVCGPQSNYMRLITEDGLVIGAKGLVMIGDGSTAVPIPSDPAGNIDYYNLPTPGEYFNDRINTLYMGSHGGFGMLDGSDVLAQYRLFLDYSAIFGALTIDVENEFIHHQSANLFSDPLNFQDENGVTPPPYWDSVDGAWKIVVNDNRTDAELLSLVTESMGFPNGRTFGMLVTLNNVPADTTAIVRLNGVDLAGTPAGVQNGMTWYLVQTSPLSLAAAGSFEIRFHNDNGLNGLDVLGTILPEGTFENLVCQNTATGEIFFSDDVVTVLGAQTDQSALGVGAFFPQATYDPFIVPMAGNGAPYGNYTATYRAQHRTTNEISEITIGVLNDGSNELVTEFIPSNLLENFEAPILNGSGEWRFPPSRPGSGSQITPGQGFIGKTIDESTLLGLRVGYDTYGGQAGVSEGLRYKQNGGYYDVPCNENVRWYVDFAAHSTDEDLLLVSETNSLHIEMRTYRNIETQGSPPDYSEGAVYDFSVGFLNDEARIICTALGYNEPLQYWDEIENVVVGRIDSSLFGAIVEADLNSGINDGSPMGHFRFILRRKKNSNTHAKLTTFAKTYFVPSA
jgi:hypothetical protein